MAQKIPYKRTKLHEHMTNQIVSDHGGLTGLGDDDHSLYAQKTNVLELDNTTEFTPDANYEPATKKYVDDNAGGATKEYSSFYLTTGGVTGVAATATTLVINNTGVNSNGSVFSLASNEVTVNKTGVFLISANVYFNQSTTSRSEYSKWLEVDSGGGYAEVAGSRFVSYQRGYDSGHTASLTLILAVTSGDKFRLRVQRTDGGSSTGYQDDNGTRLTFLEL